MAVVSFDTPALDAELCKLGLDPQETNRVLDAVQAPSTDRRIVRYKAGIIVLFCIQLLCITILFPLLVRG